MKKILSIVLVLVMLVSMFSLTGCAAKTYELAMITDVGDIDDKSFNQGTWEGIKAYAEENKISHKYYKPVEATTDAYVAAIELAIESGAKVVVTPGFLFEEAIYVVQDQYPETKFILLDGRPHTADYSTYKTSANVYSVLYAEEQVGYLAGYAAVVDGYRSLGYQGGTSVPAVCRYGFGFVQGAEAAAKELGLAKGAVKLMYNYSGDFADTPASQTRAASWYEAGTEVIFAAGGKVGNSVMSAAETAGKYVIGVDVDQSAESTTVISSAMKGLASAVQQALTAYYAGNFPGGQDVTLGAESNAVSLASFATSKWKVFSQADYDALFAALADGTIVPEKDNDRTDPTVLTLEYVTLTFVE
ncbi:MAG: BMP family ABC transporter substrate-binding protein [Clostridia bacterium]